MDNNKLIDRLHKAIEICENTGAGYYGAAFSAGELRLLVTALEAATSPAPAVVQMTDEQIDRIAGCNGLYRAMTPDDQTCKSMVKRFVTDILSASGVKNG